MSEHLRVRDDGRRDREQVSTLLVFSTQLSMCPPHDACFIARATLWTPNHTCHVVGGCRRQEAPVAVRGATTVFCDDLVLLRRLCPGAAKTRQVLPELCASGQATSPSIVQKRVRVKC
jgi:hypothetical protein